MNNSWIAMVTGAGKTTRHVVEGTTRAEAIRIAEGYTGHRVSKIWPAIGKYQSLHDARISSGRKCIAA